jgi:hypothetical protein
LTNLKADTDYVYRVQGTASNGAVYWSELASFHTPKSTGSARTNYASLANGASVMQVSSNFAGAANTAFWGANNALDNNTSTAWSSNGDGDRAFIEIRLAKATTLTSTAVWSRAMSDGSAKILRFTITTDTGQVFGPFTLNDTDKAYEFALPVTASTLRFNVVASSGGNTGLVEWAVF